MEHGLRAIIPIIQGICVKARRRPHVIAPLNARIVGMLAVVDDLVDEIDARLGLRAVAFAQKLQAEDGGALHAVGAAARRGITERTLRIRTRFLERHVADEGDALLHAFGQILHIRSRDETGLHGLILPAGDGEVPPGLLFVVVIISAACLLTIYDDLQGGFHGRTEERDFRHAVRFRQGIGDDAVDVWIMLFLLVGSIR